MARVLAFAALLVLLAGAAPANGKVDELYALRFGAKTNLLVPYDPVRLLPSGSPIRMGQFGHAWSMSPDRQRLVAAAGVRRNAAPTAVGFVDLESRQVEGTVTLPGEFSRVTATAWIRGRVLVVVSASSATRVYAVDPDRLVTISQIEFPGTVVLGERAQSCARAAARRAEQDQGQPRSRSSISRRESGRSCSRRSRLERRRPAMVLRAVSRSAVPRLRSAPPDNAPSSSGRANLQRRSTCAPSQWGVRPYV